MRKAFTIIELLVVVSIIALLVGILLPAIGKAREQAKTTISQANLRNQGTAHQSYAAEFADRQLTFINDNIATYGGGVAAFDQYYQANGGTERIHTHPGVLLGWGYVWNTSRYVLFGYYTHESGKYEEHGGFNGANASLCVPINFNSGVTYFGACRLTNAKQFSQYVSGKFYDKVFYAPKDTTVNATIMGGNFGGGNCFDDPAEYCDRPDVGGRGEIPVWSSYVLSPAAMFNPAVMRHVDPNDPLGRGFENPWTLPAGMRSPAFSQCLYPSLKTHVLEHHWLQNNTVAECNPGFDGGTYDGCEPYYFNHAWESSPMTLFYDGHVEGVGVRNTMRADGRMRTQAGTDRWGLWSKDTIWGEDGYLHQYGYDQAETSFHILTTDGIRGRDIIGD